MSEQNFVNEINKRRTFAIISCPSQAELQSLDNAAARVFARAALLV